MNKGDSVYWNNGTDFPRSVIEDINDTIATIMYDGNFVVVPVSELEENEMTCPECGRTVNRSYMDYTRDCYGITMRLLCNQCYKKVMAKGYDGRYYNANEIDEDLEPDFGEAW